MIRVLHIFNRMGNGGIERYVMNIYRHINRENVQFDFLVSINDDGWFADEIKSLGGRIYHSHSVTSNPIKNYKDTAHIIKENDYQIVHRHTGSAFGYYDLLAAKKGGAKHLILHSHNPSVGKPMLHYVSKVLFKTDCIKFSCSQESGEFLFGKKANFSVLKNTIDVDQFRFSSDKRNEIRKLHGISDDELVIGHIGRFSEQKNHKYLIDIFNSMLKKNPNSRLICIGDGKLRSEYEAYAKELGIFERIIFTGDINNVPDYLNAFDVFLFPSLYEGFGITLLEAQANGLKCFASLNKVPNETNITGNVSFISLSESPDAWASILLESDITRDVNTYKKVVSSGYDVKAEALRLEQYYISLCLSENV